MKIKPSSEVKVPQICRLKLLGPQNIQKNIHTCLFFVVPQYSEYISPLESRKTKVYKQEYKRQSTDKQVEEDGGVKEKRWSAEEEIKR